MQKKKKAQKKQQARNAGKNKLQKSENSVRNEEDRPEDVNRKHEDVPSTRLNTENGLPKIEEARKEIKGESIGRVIGLQNRGNTCYFNSLTQVCSSSSNGLTLPLAFFWRQSLCETIRISQLTLYDTTFSTTHTIFSSQVKMSWESDQLTQAGIGRTLCLWILADTNKPLKYGIRANLMRDIGCRRKTVSKIDDCAMQVLLCSPLVVQEFLPEAKRGPLGQGLHKVVQASYGQILTTRDILISILLTILFG